MNDELEYMRDLHSVDGKTIASIKQGEFGQYDSNDAILIEFTDGTSFVASHSQSCCESVSIRDIDGNMENLVGAKINSITKDSDLRIGEYDSQAETTWVKIHTTNGTLRVTFEGHSNGYYSTGVSFWGN